MASRTAMRNQALGRGSTPGPSSRWVSAALAVAVACCGLLLLSFPYGRDQGIYALVGHTILSGGIPYRDAWDFKPPGIYLIYAASETLFGLAPWGIRVLELASLGATAWTLVRLAERWWGQRLLGLLAGLLAALVHVQLDFWHSAQPETFGGTLSMLAVLLCTDHRAKRRRWRWVVAGVAFGSCGLLKPPLAGGGAVLAVWAGRRSLAAHDDSGWRERIAVVMRPAGWLALGGALPLVLCLLWLWHGEALGAARAIFLSFTPHYTRLGWHDRGGAELLLHAVADWLLGYGGAMTAGLLLLVACWHRVARRDGALLLLGIVGVNLLGVALQAKFFPYHYAACWPPTALLAALGWWHAGLLLRRRYRRALPALGAAVAVAAVARTATRDVRGSFWGRSAQRTRLLLTGLSDRATIDVLGSVADVDAAANRRIAALLRQLVPPGAPIYVWGFEPVLYQLADRAPASRFIYNVPQRVAWFSANARAELMRDLAAQPPAAIVVLARDALPMVTGDLVDSRQALRTFPGLRQLIASDYQWTAEAEDLELYLKRSGLAESRSAAPAPRRGGLRGNGYRRSWTRQRGSVQAGGDVVAQLHD